MIFGLIGSMLVTVVYFTGEHSSWMEFFLISLNSLFILIACGYHNILKDRIKKLENSVIDLKKDILGMEDDLWKKGN